MKKAGSRILIITFGIMAAIAILYPWKFVPEYDGKSSNIL